MAKRDARDHRACGCGAFESGAGVTRSVTLTLTLLALGAVACHRGEPEHVAVLLENAPGLPATGVTLWCGWDDPAAKGGDEGNEGDLPNSWVGAVSDARGRAVFPAEREHCTLRADGAVVEPRRVSLTGDGDVRVRLMPSFDCGSALVVVPDAEAWSLGWYDGKRGFSAPRSASTAELTAAARELWQEHGEHRSERDIKRDCALVLRTDRVEPARAALQNLTRRFANHRPDGERPALDVQVWTSGSLCAWTQGPIPEAMGRVLGCYGRATTPPAASASASSSSTAPAAPATASAAPAR